MEQRSRPRALGRERLPMSCAYVTLKLVYRNGMTKFANEPMNHSVAVGAQRSDLRQSG
jgi:hypothetical protein